MIRQLRIIPPLLAILLLAGCIFGGGRVIPERRAPQSGLTPTTAQTRQCYANLSRAGYSFRPLPDRDYPGGCQIRGAVQLLDIGVPVTGLKAMRCPLAAAFADWVNQTVRPAAQRYFGSDVARVETFGTYACRGIIGGSAASARRLSQHAFANAVDVSGFVLRDGRRITVEQGWRSSDGNERAFLTTIHAAACNDFDTVLSPDYNAAHHNHLHLDMGPGKFCR
ncbi:hypothetical protein FHR23_001045 [Stakelama sediminis]|uniref:Extensin-like C-terminal domain-containing protein n=1 Tax=Stakelama sediminis TaxID=463200 RepID=A0A840YWV1_9SPHN|nr:extensin family protein [Stakelama sediminis]MBB5718138.1 hypothetical protein [Stakelama sediminis]